MALIILLVLIAAAGYWWLAGDHSANRNEKLYLRRRGYDGGQKPVGPPVSSDTLLMNLLQSLDDVSANSRRRAAEELEELCETGKRDSRMFSPLVTALDDSSPIVRKAVADALASLGDARAVARIWQLD